MASGFVTDGNRIERLRFEPQPDHVGLVSSEQLVKLLKAQGMRAEMVRELLQAYDGAARASRNVLPSLPSLGFFSSQRARIGAFIEACKHMDRMIEAGQLAREEAQLAISVMAFSDKRFLRAVRAFTGWAVPRYRSDLTTDSETADLWMSSLADPFC